MATSTSASILSPSALRDLEALTSWANSANAITQEKVAPLKSKLHELFVRQAIWISETANHKAALSAIKDKINKTEASLILELTKSGSADAERIEYLRRNLKLYQEQLEKTNMSLVNIGEFFGESEKISSIAAQLDDLEKSSLPGKSTSETRS